MTRSYLNSRRDTVKRIVMALTESAHFFKTRKEEAKKIIAKFSKQDNPDYLESSYNAMAKLYERVPLVTRPGRKNRSRNPSRANPAPASRWIRS
jgi:ABC-type nitrate/sulfonate/bicarbonate transport system substrate-binding protein